MYREVSISPDGAKAVVRQGLNLWIHDLQRGTRIPLTSGTDSNILPVWSRDGARIVFASNRGGDWDIYSQPADGSRPAEVLLKRPSDQFPYHVRAGRDAAVHRNRSPRPAGICGRCRRTARRRRCGSLRFNEIAAQFSPGREGAPRWVAYASDESGRSEIYVQSYPGEERPRCRCRVVAGSGPCGRPTARSFSIVTGDAVVAVAMQPDGTFGAPRRLFDRSNFLINDRFQSYSVSPDGKRFLMIQRDPGSVPRQLNVILNWSDR